MHHNLSATQRRVQYSKKLLISWVCVGGGVLKSHFSVLSLCSPTWMSFFLPYCRWENWARFSNLTRVRNLISRRARIKLVSITSKPWGNHQTPGWCLPLRLTGYSAYVTVMSGWFRLCLPQRLNRFYELVLLELPFSPYHRSWVVPAPTRRPCIQNSCLPLWPQSSWNHPCTSDGTQTHMPGLQFSHNPKWDLNPCLLIETTH